MVAAYGEGKKVKHKVSIMAKKRSSISADTLLMLKSQSR